MKYLVVSMRDIIHHEFGHVNLEISESSAIRNFESAIMTSRGKEEGLLFSHPGDFELFVVGTFDSESGQLEPYGVNEFLMRGDDI